MKKLLLLLAFLPVLATAQDGIIWHDTVTVNSDILLGFTRPKIVLAANDVPVVMWGRANNREVYVKRWNGSGFSAPVKITPAGINAFVQNWGGPSMTASGDTIFVSFKSQPEHEGFVYVVRSTDGGQTFGDTVRVSNDNWSRFSEVSVLPGGNPVVTYMQFDSGFHNPRWVVTTSSDKGASFSAPVRGSAPAPGEVCDCCPGFILADENRLLLMFRNNDNNLRDMWAAISTDGGSTFPLAADVDHNNWMINSCPSTGPSAVIAGDSLVAVWMSGASGYSRVNIGTASLQNLGTGINSEIIPGTMANQNYPKIAGSNGIYGVVWQESQSGNMDVKFTWTVGGPQGLIGNTPEDVNLYTTSTQMNPDIAYAAGKFYIVWQDAARQRVMYRMAEVPSAPGIKKVHKQKLKVYPNPAAEYITVNFPNIESSSKTVTVYNNLGQLMLRKKFTNGEQLLVDVKELAAGVYNLQVKGNSGTAAGFFVKE